jgi:hypothetical protein
MGIILLQVVMILVLDSIRMKEYYYLVANVFRQVFHPEYRKKQVVVLYPI